MTDNGQRTIQVKICGLTRPEEAVACAEAGADAVGLVFFPKSPRHVSLDRAREISTALAPAVARMGVFVDAGLDAVMETATCCGLTGVQLHGNETPEEVDRLRAQGLVVIKALFANRAPGFDAAARYAPTAFLAECAGGTLPGGNAIAWDWSTARDLGRVYPLVLAGGLAPDNVGDAIAAAAPAAVDVSSGVEAAPGRKDLEKVRRFIDAVRRSPLEGAPGKNKIF